MLLSSKLLPDIIWLTAPLAVALSIIGMQYTKTLHPPGGATALIAVSGSESIIDLGYLYVLFPVLSGVFVLLLVALIVNYMTSQRIYPSDGSFLGIFKWFTKPIRNQSKKIKHIRFNMKK